MKVVGWFIFLAVATMAFWILIFLLTFVPYMATLLITEKFKPKWAAKLAGKKLPDDE